VFPRSGVAASSGRGALALALLSLTLAAAASRMAGSGAPSFDVVPVPAHPRRVVTLGLHADELALALAPERVVAIDAFADDPEASSVVEAARGVAGRASASVESVLAHRPDLVILPGWASPELEAGLAQGGVATVREPVPTRLGEIEESIARLGALLDAREAAAGLLTSLRAALAEVDGLAPLWPPPRAILLAATGTSPGTGTLFAELLARAGGRIALDRPGIAPLSVETLLARDPEVIFLDGYRADGRARGFGADAVIPAALRQHLQAYAAGRVHALSARLANTTSHHVAETLRALARALRR